MHPHSLLPGVRRYQGTWLWLLQVVPAYPCNHKLSFSKSYYKSNRLKRVLFKRKEVLDFENLRSNTLSCFKQRDFKTLRALPKQTLAWSKNNFQKVGFWKCFLPLIPSPSKLLAYFKCFENLAPISKCYAKRCFKPFICVLENFKKSSCLSKSVFQKKGDLWKPNFKASSKCFANW